MDIITESVKMIWDSMPLLLQGASKTVQLTFYSLIFATILGLIFGLLRISTNRWLRSIAGIYLSIIRGTPLYVQIVYIYFVIPVFIGTNVEPMTAGIVALALNAGAYLMEIFRAGIQSIDKGQTEAGRALGFTHWQTMRYIILPQAVKRMIPAFLNQFIITLKDTSLLATIGVAELMYTAQTIYANNFKAVEYLTAVAIMYWIVITFLTWVTEKIERKVS